MEIFHLLFDKSVIAINNFVKGIAKSGPEKTRVDVAHLVVREGSVEHSELESSHKNACYGLLVLEATGGGNEVRGRGTHQMRPIRRIPKSWQLACFNGLSESWM